MFLCCVAHRGVQKMAGKRKEAGGEGRRKQKNKPKQRQSREKFIVRKKAIWDFFKKDWYRSSHQKYEQSYLRE